MARRDRSSRDDLLDRWREIGEKEEEEDDEAGLVARMKTHWFSETFKFLIRLPVETHLWCGYADLMGPLLETFHKYFDDKTNDSPLQLIWKQVSKELRHCIQCVCQHHQAQETYNAEYESDTVGPLLNILQCLDEERVSQHLKEINARIAKREYDSESQSAEVVSIMFEVLMFPSLLEDEALVTEFEKFIEAIDKSHEVSLAGQQQYPGVYALLFLKNARTRAIGLRLAGCIGKLRSASDLEPLQPLLGRCIAILETETMPSTLHSSRPRVQLERTTVWLGFRALLGFLESSAFEEGILEKHPIFLSIVLNHVSDDTPEFSYAVTCLRLFFEMLGCKLWLRTTLSPSMMRNTLLGQCFHTRKEKSHKEIFDLFLPFLQSLEALQDGEHEKQRRHFLYFLLHQVTHSGNFSDLIRKNACKISLLIILRGYKMDPPSPPFECSHMWGPSLISCLKNSSLHISLRQPAFDLIQAIIVSDGSALASIRIESCEVSNNHDTKISCDLYDDEDDIPFSAKVEEKNSWTDFCQQSKIAAREYKTWRCVPMLWFDVLVQMDPLVLPVSLFKAVYWCLSHFPVVDPGIDIERSLSVTDWLSSYAGEISPSFVWSVPSGYDDGGDGKESKNSVSASLMCVPLMKAFKRCATHFITTMEHRQLIEQWTWEPRMSETLILSLISPDDTVRHANKIILEHISKTRGLTSGLQFLCSNSSSFSAIYLGLKFTNKQVQLNNGLSNFHYLHHLFFVVRKLLKEVVPFQNPLTNHKEYVSASKLSNEGGFLRLPCASQPSLSPQISSNLVDVCSWSRFCRLLSLIFWPSILKCLAEGKQFIDMKNCQMTCVRLLETLPVVFEWIITDWPQQLQTSLEMPASQPFDFCWLFDFVDWGKSSLLVVVRHWKQSILNLTNLLSSWDVSIQSYADAIQRNVCNDTFEVADLKKHVSEIALALRKKMLCTSENASVKLPQALLEDLPSNGTKSNISSKSVIMSEVEKMERNVVVILSDDEDGDQPIKTTTSAFSDKNETQLHANKVIFPVDSSVLGSLSAPEELREHTLIKRGAGKSEVSSQREINDLDKNIVSSKMPFHAAKSYSSLKHSAGLGKQETKAAHFRNNSSKLVLESDSLHDKASTISVGREPSVQLPSRIINESKHDAVIREFFGTSEDNSLNKSVDPARQSKSLLMRPSVSVPKRKVVQLDMPLNNKSGCLNRLSSATRRLKPPRLDDWYRPILEMDYFVIAGLDSSKEDNREAKCHLKEVPLCFNSPEHYVEIFRPLVLEEFKAQLNSSCVEASSQEDMCRGSLCILSVERIDDFHLVRGSPECELSPSKGYMENDLILLTKDPLQNSPQPLHALGKVERREKNYKTRSDILVIRFYFQSTVPRLNKMKRFLTERSKWCLSRIMTLTPQLREFQALSSLNDIPLLPIILNPTDSSFKRNNNRSALEKLPQALQKTLKSSFNASQLLAISGAIGFQGSRKAFELSLIQGPPGTGKTRTIVAIVSALLALKSCMGASLRTNSNSRSSSVACFNANAQVSQAAATARAWQDAALAWQIGKDEIKDRCGSIMQSSRRRVLICAQSNAAVDELVSRIHVSLHGIDGEIYKPYLVRVGNVKTVHPSSLPYFIDTLVDQRLAEDKNKEAIKGNNDLDSSSSLRAKLEKIVDNIRQYESMQAKLRDGNVEGNTSLEDAPSKDAKEIPDGAVGAKLKALYVQKKSVSAEIAIAQARERKSFEESKLIRSKIRKSIIREAEIVVTTLSGCGGDIYGVCSDFASSGKFGSSPETFLFDAVVIDEAAQALEPATLIPLQLLKSNGTKCVMVGDPKQLPATVLSNVASKFLYECSMFERLQRAGHPVVMLTEQYRMHPEICKFPSLHFYENKLLNGVEMSSKVAPFHEKPCFGPYMFFDVIDGRERQGRKLGSLSLYNEAEAEATIGILKFLRKRYMSEFSAGRMGVITPYKSQLSILRSRCSSELGSSVTADIEFNTVDGFQGREVDILLLSTVRASDPSAKKSMTNSSLIGFVADVRRMNVALTRARLSLWVIGNARTLQTNLHWRALIDDAKERCLFMSISRPYISCFERKFKDKGGSSTSFSHSKHLNKESRSQERSTAKHQDTSCKAKSSFKPTCDGEDHEKYKDKQGSNDDCKKLLHSNTNLGAEENTSKDKNLRTSTLKRECIADCGSQHQGDERKKQESFGHTHSPKYLITSENRKSKNFQIDTRQEKNSSSKASRKKEKTCELVSSSPNNSDQLKSEIVESCVQNQECKKEDCKNLPRDSHNAQTDLIATRKRQREAVDSLLSSSLISSKKPENLSKSALVERRMTKPKSAGENFKSSRLNKGKLH